MERTLFDFDDEIDNLTQVSERYIQAPSEKQAKVTINEEPQLLGSVDRKRKRRTAERALIVKKVKRVAAESVHKQILDLKKAKADIIKDLKNKRAT